jgi:hypothetical protein
VVEALERRRRIVIDRLRVPLKYYRHASGPPIKPSIADPLYHVCLTVTTSTPDTPLFAPKFKPAATTAQVHDPVGRKTIPASSTNSSLALGTCTSEPPPLSAHRPYFRLYIASYRSVLLTLQTPYQVESQGSRAASSDDPDLPLAYSPSLLNITDQTGSYSAGNMPDDALLSDLCSIWYVYIGAT